MAPLVEIARTGLAAVRLHPLRSVVSCTAIVVVLLPYLVGLALSRGLEAEAEASALCGADLYVTAKQFGRPVPVPLEAVAALSSMDGVKAVVPRIVGEVTVGKERLPAVLVGLPPEHFAASDWTSCLEGELPHANGPDELVIGTVLAQRLGLKVGSVLPPFYRNDKGERVSRVVGLFRSDAPLWQANLILTRFDTACRVFAQQGLATDLLVWCRPGYQEAVSRRIEQEIALPSAKDRGTPRLRVTAREDLLALIPRDLLHREGIFNLHFVLAFAVGILVVLVTSGFGLAERRREIGILKATGWQTDEVLLRGAVESLCLSLASACMALLLAWVWLRLFNGYGLAGLFLGDIGVAPAVPVPFRLTPIPALLGFVLATVVVMSGTLYSSWRAATVAPREAMR